MKKAKIIYWLMNDMLRYLLIYCDVETFTDAQVEQALAESEQICEKYRDAPDDIGYLARRMCVAANSYFSRPDRMKTMNKEKVIQELVEV